MHFCYEQRELNFDVQDCFLPALLEELSADIYSSVDRHIDVRESSFSRQCVCIPDIGDGLVCASNVGECGCSCPPTCRIQASPQG